MEIISSRIGPNIGIRSDIKRPNNEINFYSSS
jgi:hypothetical protein